MYTKFIVGRLVIGVVFKNPYGFFIKHFKLIHLMLTGIYIYMAIEVNKILGYYNDFIAGVVDRSEAAVYFNMSYKIPIIMSVVFCLIIYAVLRYKKKPGTLYLGLIAFSFVVNTLISIVSGGLEVIYFGVLDVKTLRLYRDLLRILVIFQYLSIIVVLIRGLGFDIKKFNFASDLHELNLNVSDLEEVELTIGGTETLSRKFNRKLREFKYYYVENKVFICICVVLLVVFGVSSLFVKNEFIDKVYEQNEQFSTDYFTFNVLDSYVTTKGYDNEVISDNDVAFVIMKMSVSANGGKRKLNDGHLALKINYKNYTNDNYHSSSFVDLGNVYRGQEINGNNTYIFIFEIDIEDINKKMQFVYAGDKEVNLNPIKLDEEKKEKKYKLGEKIDFSDSTFGSGELIIDSYEFGNKFSYPFKYEINGQEKEGKYTIDSKFGVILKLDLVLDIPVDLDNYKFFNTYAVLKYKLDGVVYESDSISDKTPKNEDKKLYLDVNKNVSNAEEIWFEIQIRNSKYRYMIK